MQKRRQKPKSAKFAAPSRPVTESESAARAQVAAHTGASESQLDSPQRQVPPGASLLSMPSFVARRVISAALVAHFVAIAISFTAVIEPSSVQLGLVGVLQPYLQLTHFGADSRPIYLAHNETTEQPHRLEWSSSTDPSEGDWQPIKSDLTGGLAAADRLGRFLATAAALAQNEESSVVADLLLPLVRAEPNMQAIRIVRLPTELTTVVDDAAPPPYVARVLRRGSAFQVVQIKSARLVTAPAPQIVTEK